MNRICSILVLGVASFLPVAAGAVSVASTDIPDGTYTGKVLKVIDAKHIDILLDDGKEATLPAGRPYLDFSKVRPNDQIKLSVISGNVMVYVDLTSH